MTTGIDRVAVVGAGTMGHGIALAYALGGHPVSLFDVSDKVLETASGRIDSVLETFVDHGILAVDEAERVRERIDYDATLETAVEDADLVTEAVVEDAGVKRETFDRLDVHAPADAILATNTSGLSITDLSTAVDDPGRVVGTHWFNPPYVVPLVEVVHGEHTDGAVAERAYDALDAVGKTPVTVEKDVPGFIGNRIQLAMTYEAYSLLDRGVASAEAIDRAVKAGFGFRLPILGIFEKVDHSGLDVHHDVESYLMPDLDRGTEPNPVVTRLVERGDLGLKTGKGVYDWSDADPEEVFERRDRLLLDQLSVYEAGEK